jgi:integrase
VWDLNRRDCRQLITLTRDKGLKIATVRGIVRTLSTVLAQAVDDEYLPANPALALRKYLRTGDDAETKVDPFTREEAEHLIETAQKHYPEWYPWVLCGLRTGLRAGELLALQWGDVDWRGRYLQVQRNIVRGTHTTPKNHQTRRVDLSPQLRRELRLWRRRLHRKWVTLELPRPEWIFPSATGTPFDDSNVRKAFHLVLDKAGLHRRGQHQMRHSFASQLLHAGEPITYVSRQLGHKGSAITLALTPTGSPTPRRARVSIRSTLRRRALHNRCTRPPERPSAGSPDR